jgi:hypothetical protein
VYQILIMRKKWVYAENEGEITASCKCLLYSYGVVTRDTQFIIMDVWAPTPRLATCSIVYKWRGRKFIHVSHCLQNSLIGDKNLWLVFFALCRLWCSVLLHCTRRTQDFHMHHITIYSWRAFINNYWECEICSNNEVICLEATSWTITLLSK